mmetsp:Transcript_86212/g.189396  ORF Transcript_86212/g.189396 Transcript_86212/m.189396 type:complete len:121 (+) Transcript_86212:71-433(+)
MSVSVGVTVPTAYHKQATRWLTTIMMINGFAVSNKTSTLSEAKRSVKRVNVSETLASLNNLANLRNLGILDILRSPVPSLLEVETKLKKSKAMIVTSGTNQDFTYLFPHVHRFITKAPLT